MSETIEITQPILSWSVATNDEKNKPEPAAVPVLADVDPRHVRIPRRADGTLKSVTRKVTLHLPDGPRKYYVIISYIDMAGVYKGKPITIERPMEFFLVAGQNGPEYEWITATLRTLSLAARSGFVVKALSDLRQIKTGEAIRYGKYRKSGKGRVHESQVATLAWAIQDELELRGYLTDKYEEVDLEKLVQRYEITKLVEDELERRINTLLESKGLEQISGNTIAVSTGTSTGASSGGAAKYGGAQIVGTCPMAECGGDLVTRDGCPTCMTCSYSKCD